MLEEGCNILAAGVVSDQRVDAGPGVPVDLCRVMVIETAQFNAATVSGQTGFEKNS